MEKSVTRGWRKLEFLTPTGYGYQFVDKAGLVSPLFNTWFVLYCTKCRFI
jgi:hypothetical protein